MRLGHYSCVCYVLVLIACGSFAVGCSARSPPKRSIASTPRGETPLASRDAQTLALNDQEYFERRGLNIMAFSDFYPEGHQGGVTIVQNGVRTAAGGDVRLESAPGQWQPVPKLDGRRVNVAQQTIVTRLSYPDASKDGKGFNPLVYPDLEMSYEVEVRAEGPNALVTVHLAQPLPQAWVGRVGFNLELFPGEYFGKAFLVDGHPGVFPRQVNGPIQTDGHGHRLAEALGQGKVLTAAPSDPRLRLRIEALQGGTLTLLDGRSEHNNGWFVVRGLLAAGATRGALQWRLSPSTLKGFTRVPVIHHSQVGYHPGQSKVAVLEVDPLDTRRPDLDLWRYAQDGTAQVALKLRPKDWGNFLRYRYLQADFSAVRLPGVYQLRYGNQSTPPFVIDGGLYDRHVWQPTLEYFLPVQMCHMRVNDRYRVWHDLCHQDDARMAPTDRNHFDGYVQGPQTLTPFAPGQFVPGLAVGGWHDAGDYDLRVESQVRTVRMLAHIYEEFGVNYDATRVDQRTRVVELHQPDGIADVLQQIEHGVLSILGGYEKLGRLYRGIIAPTKRQYVLLGDATAQTDGQTDSSPTGDDRWVFTEHHPKRQLEVSAGLAAASRVLREYAPALAERCEVVARQLYEQEVGNGEDSLRAIRIEALAELILATGDAQFRKALLARVDEVVATIESSGWALGRLKGRVNSPSFWRTVEKALIGFRTIVEEQTAKTPFGVPYTPKIWGAGWEIQRAAVPQYFLHEAWPQIFGQTQLLSALAFVLGNHPGVNTASFVSGVGAESLTVAYGVNRADWSYIPGGVGSGTALIRPDFPELKKWPFFWQQSEYVIGGGGTHFMFLALAAQHWLNGQDVEASTAGQKTAN